MASRSAAVTACSSPLARASSIAPTSSSRPWNGTSGRAGPLMFRHSTGRRGECLLQRATAEQSAGVLFLAGIHVQQFLHLRERGVVLDHPLEPYVQRHFAPAGRLVGEIGDGAVWFRTAEELGDLAKLGQRLAPGRDRTAVSGGRLTGDGRRI